ncbi:MAG: hypothetical protein RI907_989 [Pseudomonadota bacterium]|jgi:hypothetical protein
MSTTPKPAIKAAGSKAAQRALCLHLLALRPRHTYELRQMGISHPAARMQELIELGEPITSARITTVDGDGFLHRGVALYSLAPGTGLQQGPKKIGPDAGSTEAEQEKGGAE